MSIFNAHYQEDLLAEVEENASIELENKPFDFDKEIMAKIPADAEYLSSGAHTRRIIRERYQLLQSLDVRPEYHGTAREYWLEYRSQLIHRVRALCPNRPLDLPTW
ncbi:hypothetical protein IIZ77_03185 [Candidatus Saccharibacteria bacterium]|nr:hypothetical protein [Candidatus Saccharibacteria bacterium]